MKLRVNRRTVLVTGITTLLMASVAWSSEQHVITLTTPAMVTAGEPIQATVGVNQGTVNVTITSNPAGLVNQTITASSGSTTTVLSTNPNAPAGTYQLVATPVGGGGSYVQSVQLANDPGL